jgi:hypothetical protein
MGHRGSYALVNATLGLAILLIGNVQICSTRKPDDARTVRSTHRPALVAALSWRYGG